MPGLATMTKAEMSNLIRSVWGLLDKEHVPTHHGPRKRDAYSLYGRVYRALVEGECDGPRGQNRMQERLAHVLRRLDALGVEDDATTRSARWEVNRGKAQI